MKDIIERVATGTTTVEDAYRLERELAALTQAKNHLTELVIKLQEELNREREECAKLCEGERIIMDGRPARRGPRGAGTWYEDSPLGAATRAIASAIRSRGGVREWRVG